MFKTGEYRRGVPRFGLPHNQYEPAKPLHHSARTSKEDYHAVRQQHSQDKMTDDLFMYGGIAAVGLLALTILVGRQRR